jgi:RecB family endonuclease NucS
MQRYFALTSEDNQIKTHEFKPWFRRTQGVADTQGWTSHRMRDYMKKLGWATKDAGDRVFVVQPGVNPLTDVSAERPGTSSTDGEDGAGSLFALESHLRDFLARNLNQAIKWKSHLEVVDVEYSTDVGFIDLLAKDASGELVIFEFKLDRGPDAALGQLLRYMGWCRRNLANTAKVHGVILAADITNKLRYAASMVPDVHLFEYELQFTAKLVSL